MDELQLRTTTMEQEKYKVDRSVSEARERQRRAEDEVNAITAQVTKTRSEVDDLKKKIRKLIGRGDKD